MSSFAFGQPPGARTISLAKAPGQLGRPWSGGVVQGYGIGFKPISRRREAVEIAINDLREDQLEDILKNPDAPNIVYFPATDKDKLVADVRDRLNAIQEARLKKISDGGLGYVSGSSRYVTAVYPQPDKATQSSLDSAYSGLKFEVVAPRSPIDYGASIPPETVHSPGGTTAYRSGAYGSNSPGGSFHGVALYSSAFPKRLELYTRDTPVLLPVLKVPCTVTSKDSGWQTIDVARLKRWAGKRDGYSPDQNGAMGGISASAAAAHSGFVTGEWEWLHLIAFTLGGIGESRINHADNLVAGTVGANRVHKVIEDTIKSLLVGKITSEVLVQACATVEPDSYHLGTRLEYKIKFHIGMIPGAGDLKEFNFWINPLDPNPAQGGNLDILRSSLPVVESFAF